VLRDGVGLNPTTATSGTRYYFLTFAIFLITLFYSYFTYTYPKTLHKEKQGKAAAEQPLLIHPKGQK
jgi:hypothetical protein